MRAKIQKLREIRLTPLVFLPFSPFCMDINLKSKTLLRPKECLAKGEAAKGHLI